MFIVLNNGGNVFVQFVFQGGLNKILPFLYGKNKLDVKLGEGVAHNSTVVIVDYKNNNNYDLQIIYKQVAPLEQW